MFDNMYSKLSTVLKYINGKVRDSFTFAENLQTVELQFPPITKKQTLQFKTHKKCTSSGLKTSFP